MGVKLVASSGGSVELVPTNTASDFTVTVPASTTTMVGTDATQTLTNKTLTSPALTTPIASTTIGVGGATASASGAGITFPATQSASSDANTLDDYEEGTWTPTLSQSFVGISSPTSVSGRYIKVGKLLFLTAYFYKSSGATSGSGAWRFEGLPFNLATGAEFTVAAGYNTINGTVSTQAGRFQANGTNYLDLYGQFATTSWTSSYIEFGFCGVFQTTA